MARHFLDIFERELTQQATATSIWLQTYLRMLALNGTVHENIQTTIRRPHPSDIIKDAAILAPIYSGLKG